MDINEKSYLFGICMWLKNQKESKEYEKTDERSIFHYVPEFKYAELILRYINENRDVINNMPLIINENIKESNIIKKCIISRYDENITKPPYLTIPIDSMDILEPIDDDYGHIFAERIRFECIKKGYIFKFYTMSKDKEFDYEIVVY